jgi:hypothetical protein
MKTIFDIYLWKKAQAAPPPPPSTTTSPPPMAGGVPGAPGTTGSRHGDIRGVDIDFESNRRLIDKINELIAEYLASIPKDYISNSSEMLDEALAVALRATGSRFPIHSAHWDLSTYPPRVLGFGTMDLGPAPAASPAPAPPPGMM